MAKMEDIIVVQLLRGLPLDVSELDFTLMVNEPWQIKASEYDRIKPMLDAEGSRINVCRIVAKVVLHEPKKAKKAKAKKKDK